MRETPSSSLCDLLQDTHLYMQSEKTMRQCVVSSLFKVLLFEEIMLACIVPIIKREKSGSQCGKQGKSTTTNIHALLHTKGTKRSKNRSLSPLASSTFAGKIAQELTKHLAKHFSVHVSTLATG